MQTENELQAEIDHVKQSHPTGWGGILQQMEPKKEARSLGLWLSIIIAVSLTCLKGASTNQMVFVIVDLILAVFPNLLGFLLGGYALIIGFGNVRLLEALAEPRKDSQTSLFQLTSAVFAYALLVLAITLFLAFLLKVLSSFALLQSPSWVPPIATSRINMGVSMLILFLSFYSFNKILSVVVNVFAYGQLHHLHLRCEAILKKANERS